MIFFSFFPWREWTHPSLQFLPLPTELTDWKRLWCWEGLGAGGKGDDRGWDGWMASLTRTLSLSELRWWRGRPGMLLFMGLQRVGHDWVTGLNWTELNWIKSILKGLITYTQQLCDVINVLTNLIMLIVSKYICISFVIL